MNPQEAARNDAERDRLLAINTQIKLERREPMAAMTHMAVKLNATEKELKLLKEVVRAFLEDWDANASNQEIRDDVDAIRTALIGWKAGD